MAIKRPSDDALRGKMNEYAGILLDATYGHLRPPAEARAEAQDHTLPADADAAILPKADIFNAVVNWIRTDAGMEPVSTQKSGVEKLRERMDPRGE